MSRQLPIAVIGPHDLTDRVCEVAKDYPALEALPYSYDHEGETESLVLASRQATAGFLFTGVVPYRTAEVAGLLDRPATYVSYTGASLYRALLQLVLEGHDIERFSIDTLDRQQVHEALEEADLPTDHVAVSDQTTQASTEELIRFHRRARETHGTTVAISCLRSAYDALKDEMHAVRLTPALQSIRAALSSLLSDSHRYQTQHAQVALGIVELSESEGGADADRPQDLITRHSVSLGGSVVPLSDGTHLIVTTRGLLEDATGGFRALPLVEKLALAHRTVHVGFGIGQSAADAQVLARSALRRSRALGHQGAAVALNADAVLDLTVSGEVSVEPPSIPLLAQRAGMRRETLERLRDLVESREDRVVTASEVAEHFGVEPRAGRRILAKLNRAGLAEAIGRQHRDHAGRPAITYRIRPLP